MPVRKSTAKVRAPQLETADEIEEGSTRKPLFKFMEDWLPVPVIDVNKDGSERKADNVNFFDLDSATEKSGFERDALVRSYRTFLKDIGLLDAPRCWHASIGDVVAGTVGGFVFGGVVCERLHDLVIVQSHDNKRHEAFRPSEVVLILPEARVKLQESAGNRTRSDIGSVRAIARRSKLQASAENRGTR